MSKQHNRWATLVALLALSVIGCGDDASQGADDRRAAAFDAGSAIGSDVDGGPVFGSNDGHSAADPEHPDGGFADAVTSDETTRSAADGTKQADEPSDDEEAMATDVERSVDQSDDEVEDAREPNANHAASEPSTIADGTQTPTESDDATGAVVACVVGSYDHDADPTTPCQPWSECAAGQYVFREGSATSDRQCGTCPSGQFSSQPNQTSCEVWSVCEPGSFVADEPSASADRRCSPCAPGEHSDVDNSPSCAAAEVCAPGTYAASTAAGGDPTGSNCQPCPAGNTCPGGDSAPVACGIAEWDGGNPAVACVPHSVCPEGSYATNVPDAQTDRSCAACPEGSYSDAPNADLCLPQTVCTAGNRVASDADATSDRTCEPCASGTYSSTDNATECEAQKTCLPGFVVTQSPTATRDRMCARCGSGSFSAHGNATQCTPWRECPSGQSEDVPGTETSDRTCHVTWPLQYGTRGTDEGRAIVSDSMGDLIVSGTLVHSLVNRADGATRSVSKLSKDDARVLWTTTLPLETATGSEALAVDPAGDVYVIHNGEGEFGNFTNAGLQDTFVVKLSGTDGSEVWTRQLATASDDVGTSLAVDSTGRVIVAGATRGTLGSSSSGSEDVFVAQLEADDGQLLWVRQFGTTSGTANPSVAVDANDDLIIAGEVSGNIIPSGALGSVDLFVTKLSGLDGSTQWTQQFGTDGFDGYARVAVDGSGDAFVFAMAGGEGGLLVAKFAGIDGTSSWSRSLDGLYVLPASILVGADSNPYLVFSGAGDLGGPAHGSVDVAFWKVSGSDGSTLFSHTFGTPELDIASGATLSVDGAAYVTGWTSGDMAGIWGNSDAFVYRLAPELSAPCSIGEYVAVPASAATPAVCNECPAGTFSDTLNARSCTEFTPCAADETEAVAPSAINDRICSAQWPLQFGTADMELARDLVVASDGNLVIAGRNDSDAFVSKISINDGSVLWSVPFDDVNVPALAIAADDHVLVVRATFSVGLLTKLSDEDGSELWTVDLTPTTTIVPNKIGFEVDSIDVAPNGDIVVAGGTQRDVGVGSNSDWQAFVFRLSGVDGSTIWANALGTDGDEREVHVRIDSAGDVFAVGETTGSFAATSQGGNDIFLAKLGGDSGELIWTRQVGSTGWENYPRLAIDPLGNPVVAASAEAGVAGQPTLGMLDVFVWSVDGLTGTDRWLRQIGTAMGESLADVAIDTAGDIVLTGATTGDFGAVTLPPRFLDVFVVRLAAKDGSQLAGTRIGSGAGDTGSAVAPDGSGGVYVAGQTESTVTGAPNAGNTDLLIHYLEPGWGMAAASDN